MDRQKPAARDWEEVCLGGRATLHCVLRCAHAALVRNLRAKLLGAVRNVVRFSRFIGVDFRPRDHITAFTILDSASAANKEDDLWVKDGDSPLILTNPT